MDALKPLLTSIVRLEVQHKPVFYIAGVKESSVDSVKLEKAKQEAMKKKKLQSEENNSQKHNEKSDDTDKHLDTWA